MTSIASSPGARRLFVLSIVARLPLAMLSIGLLVHAQHLTGSFAAAGVVTGAYAVALGVGGPLLGRARRPPRPDAQCCWRARASPPRCSRRSRCCRRRPVAVLHRACGRHRAGHPAGRRLPARAAAGAARRSRRGPRRVRRSRRPSVELTWIFGPPLALGLGALWSTGAALALGGVVLLVATAAFAAQPASRALAARRRRRARPRGGSLRTPAMRTLVIVLVAVGVLFGADRGRGHRRRQDARRHDSRRAATRALGRRLVDRRLARSPASAAARAAPPGSRSCSSRSCRRPPGADRRRRQRRRARRPCCCRRRRDRADLGHRLRDGRAGRPGRHHDRGVRLARHGDGGRRRRSARPAAGVLADRAGPGAAFALAGGAGAVAVLVTLLRSRTISAGQSAVAGRGADGSAGCLSALMRPSLIRFG